MALEFPSVEALGTVWEWSKKNLDTWFRTIGSLKNTVVEHDLGTDETLVFSIQFSFFCVFLSELATLPIFVVSEPKKLGFSLILADVVGYYLFFTLMAVCQKVSSLIVFGHGSLRSSVIVTLFASAYLPLAHIPDYLVLINTTSVSRFLDNYYNTAHVYEQVFEEQPGRGVGFLATSFILAIFLMIRFIPATRVVHRVGRFRATFLCIITMILSVQAYIVFLLPLDKLLLSPV